MHFFTGVGGDEDKKRAASSPAHEQQQAPDWSLLMAKLDTLTAKVDKLNTDVAVLREANGVPEPKKRVDHEHLEEVWGEEHERRKSVRREHLLAKFAREEVFGINDVARPGDGHRGGRRRRGRAARMLALWKQRIVVRPYGRFRLLWDCAAIVLVLYVALSLPYRIAFVETFSVFYAVADLLLDIFFLGDIALNFTTAFYQDGALIVSHAAIAKHYAASWLLLDLLASVPFDWFLGDGITFEPAVNISAVDATVREVLRITKLVKLLRLLRILRLYRYASVLHDQFSTFNTNVLRLVAVLTLMACYSHWNGCIQYLLATFEAEYVVSPNGSASYVFHPDSWVSRMQAEGTLTEGNAWSWAFLIAVGQLLAISLGVKEPRRQIELWGYLVSVFLGAMMYGLFIASLTTAVSESDHSAKQYRSKLNTVNEYMRFAKLPREMRDRLRKYYELWYPSRRSFDEKAILSELSYPLRRQVTLHQCRAVLEALQLVSSDTKYTAGPRAEEDGLQGAIAQYLERFVFVDEDFFYHQGEDSEGMFFIAEGKVEVLSTNGLVLTTLGDHSFFGEMSLINPEAGAVASVRAKGFCQGYFLSRSCYQKLIRTHPTFERYIETIAKMRLRRQSASGAALMADHKKARPSGAKAGPTLEAERTALQQNIAELGSPERSVQLSDAPRPDLGGTSTFLGRGDYPGALRGPLVA